jgi:hypothetical protein
MGDLLSSQGGNGAQAAVIFDDAIPADKVNIRSDRAMFQSAIDNTKVGITNLGSQEGSWNALAVGVTADYASIGGGTDNEATDDNATVSGGAGNSATGYASAVAGGYLNQATNEAAFAMGEENLASGEGSCAIGVLNQATDFYAFAQGVLSEATNQNAIAMGQSCEASGDSCVAMGAGTLASGNASMACCSNNDATGDYAFASGNGGTADGHYSRAGGSGCQSSGYYSVAEGASCQTNDDFANATNFGTTAGFGGHAEGDTCSTTGEFAHAEGRLSVGGGKRSHAQGVQAVTSRESQDAMAGGCFVTAGDAQGSSLVLRGSTPGALPGESVNLRYGAAFDQDFTLANDTTYTMVVTGTALSAASAIMQSFKQMFSVRVDNLGNATLAGTGTLDQTGDAGAVSWTLVGAVAVGPLFVLTFNTGVTTEAVRVVARVDFVEVLFP